MLENTVRHFGVVTTGILRGTQAQSQNSAVQSCRLSRTGQYNKYVQTVQYDFQFNPAVGFYEIFQGKFSGRSESLEFPIMEKKPPPPTLD